MVHICILILLQWMVPLLILMDLLALMGHYHVWGQVILTLVCLLVLGQVLGVHHHQEACFHLDHMVHFQGLVQEWDLMGQVQEWVLDQWDLGDLLEWGHLDQAWGLQVHQWVHLVLDHATWDPVLDLMDHLLDMDHQDMVQEWDLEDQEVWDHLHEEICLHHSITGLAWDLHLDMVLADPLDLVAQECHHLVWEVLGLEISVVLIQGWGLHLSIHQVPEI